MKLETTFTNKLIIFEIPAYEINSFLNLLILNIWKSCMMPKWVDQIGQPVEKKLPTEPNEFQLKTIVDNGLKVRKIIVEKLNNVEINLDISISESNDNFVLSIDRFFFDRDDRSRNLIEIVRQTIKNYEVTDSNFIDNPVDDKPKSSIEKRLEKDLKKLQQEGVELVVEKKPRKRGRPKKSID